MFILLGLVFASIWLIAWGAFKRILAWLQAGSETEQTKRTSSIWLRMMGWTLIALILSVFILGMLEAALPQDHEHDHAQAIPSQSSGNNHSGYQPSGPVTIDYPHRRAQQYQAIGREPVAVIRRTRTTGSGFFS